MRGSAPTRACTVNSSPHGLPPPPALQIAKFVVGLGDKVAPTDIEEGMRVGVDRNKYQIQVRPARQRGKG